MLHAMLYVLYIDGLVQDCSNSNALGIELLQYCTKPSICETLCDNSVNPTNDEENVFNFLDKC